MSSSNIVIGGIDCPLHKVVALLKSSPFFHHYHEQLGEISRSLATPRMTFNKLQMDYRLKMITLTDIIYELLEDWVDRMGNAATLQELVKILQENELRDSSELLMQTLVTGKDARKAPNYTFNKNNQVPDTLQQFVIGGKDCSIPKVISLLRKSRSFHLLKDKFTDISIDLGTPWTLLNKLREDFLLGNTTSLDRFCLLLEDWVCREGSTATIYEFVRILDKNGLQDCSEMLTTSFLKPLDTGQNDSYHFSKYTKVPDGHKQIVIGTRDCSISKVLRSSPTFLLLHDKFTDISIDLDTPRVLIKKLRVDLLLDNITLADVVHELIEEWVCRNGSSATLQALLFILEDNGLQDISETLRRNFIPMKDIGQSADRNIKKHARAPNGLEEYLTGSCKFCIIHTLDVGITCDKITNSLDGYNYNFYEFGEFISLPCPSDISKYNLYIVKNTTLTNIEHLCSMISHQELNSKTVFVTLEDMISIQKVFETSDCNFKIELCSDNVEWADLTLSYQHDINERLKEMYDVEFNVEKLDGKILVDLINGREVMLFKDTFPAKLQYYINRILQCRSVISLQIFENTCPDIFLFTGISSEELSRLIKNKTTDTSSSQTIHQQKITSGFLVLDKPTHFEQICEMTNAPVHLLHWENVWFRWLKSRGSMRVMQQLVHSCQFSYSEDEFCSNVDSTSSQAICISDSLGMGKSVLMANIARKLKKLYPDRIVFFINLCELVQQVRKSAITDIHQAVPNSLKAIVCENALGEAALNYKLNAQSGENTLIELILDGLDEVHSSDFHLAFEILGVIRMSLKSIRLWVTSRPHLLEELENHLGVLGYNIQPFDEDNQVQFLTSFWSLSGDVRVNPRRNEQFAKLCLSSAMDLLKDKDHNMAGIPLMCLMIGQVFEEDAIKYAHVNNDQPSYPNHINIFSLVNLYHRFVEKKFEKYSSTFGGLKLTTQNIMEMHVALSMELLFPGYSVLPHSHGDVKIEELLRIGILESSGSRSNPRFIHRTFAEYFVGWFMVENLKSWHPSWSRELSQFLMEQVLKTEVVTKRYVFTHNTICYFINYLLTEMPGVNPENIIDEVITQNSHQIMQQIAHACINNNFSSILDLLIRMKLLDQYSREIFNQEFLSLTIKLSSSDMVKIVLDRFQQHYSFGSDVQLKVLTSAFERGNFSIVDYLVKKHNLRWALENLDTGSNMLNACISDTIEQTDTNIGQKIKVVKYLLRVNQKLLEETGDNGQSPLLTSGVHIELLTELIRNGANVFSRDQYKNALFHLSPLRDHLSAADYYHTLVTSIPEESLLELVHLNNIYQQTPLMCLVGEIDPLPKTISLLKKFGADFNSAEMHGYSILAHAIIKGRRADTLRSLIECGADTSWSTAGSDSLLHLAAAWGNKEAVIILTDDSCLDVNAKNDNGLTPLDCAVQSCYSEGSRIYEIGMLLHERGATLTEITRPEGQSLLHIAARDGSLESTRLLIQLGAAINNMDIEGNTPFHYALEYRKTKDYFPITELLLLSGADPAMTNNLGETPLQSALRNKDVNLETIMLLESKMNMRWSNDTAHLALLALLQKGRRSEEDEFNLHVKECARDGVSVHINYVNDDGNSFLHLAAEYQYDRALKFLLDKKGMDMNMTNIHGQTVLHSAVLGRDKAISVQMIKYLVDNGADVYAKDDKDRTFLHLFVSQSQDLLSFNSHIRYLTECLIEHNHISLFNVKGGPFQTTPFQLAIAYHDMTRETLTLLKSNGVDFNAVDICGDSILSYAITWHRSSDFISQLIIFGVNPTSLNNNKMSLLHLSTLSGTVDTVELLLKLNTLDINGQDIKGHTPLHYALLGSDSEKIILAKCKLLVEKGANVNFKNNLGQTPLHLAATCKDTDVCLPEIKYLVENGADVTERDEEGSTFLHLLLRRCPPPSPEQFHDIIEFLVENGYSSVLSM